MASNTPNLNLIKPAQSDFYNVDDFNTNADIINREQLKHTETLNGIKSNTKSRYGNQIR